MRLLVALLVLAACGSKAPAPVEPSPASTDEAADTDTAPPSPPPPEAAPDKPCDAECAACMDECTAGSDGDYDCEADCM